MKQEQILLVALNAKYIHSNPAIYSLAAYANEVTENVILAEYTINDRYEDVLFGILEKNIGVIGFSVYIWNADFMQKIMEDIHKIKPEWHLLAGGPEATNDWETYLQWCDGVMLGEGEENFRRIAKAVWQEQEIPWDTLEGVAYEKDRQRLVREPGVTSMTSMDEIPFLYNQLEPFENRIIYYESSRGCPFRCSYCLSSIEKKVRYRSMEIVLKELQYFLDKQVKQVKFIDRTFNSSSQRALQIWTYLKEHDNGITNFHFEIGADLLTEEEIALLKTLRPGLVQLEIGIQSTSEKTMDVIHRTTDNQKLFRNVRALREAYNINLHTDLIAGLPYEDYQRFQQSFNDIYPLYADQLQLGFLKVLKGTDMYDHREEYGLLYASHQPYEVFSTKWLTYEENMKLHKVCDAVELFYNAQILRYSLKYMENYFSSPYEMFQKLAEYLEENGYLGIGIATKKKYEMIEDFGVGHGLPPEFLQYVKFDKMLHTHQSRRMSATETFLFDGKEKTYRFDYTQMHPVTGEAFAEEVVL